MNKSKKIALYTGFAVLSSLVLTCAGIAVADSSCDHIAEPCIITKLTGNPNHQIKKLNEAGFMVTINTNEDTGGKAMIIRTIPNHDPDQKTFSNVIVYKKGK